MGSIREYREGGDQQQMDKEAARKRLVDALENFLAAASDPCPFCDLKSDDHPCECDSLVASGKRAESEIGIILAKVRRIHDCQGTDLSLLKGVCDEGGVFE